MLVFVIPLKSQQVAKSWERVSKLLERTLKSVCNQTSPNFRVVVVCHEKPQIEFTHPHIKYIEVDFPVPKMATFEDKHTDKGRKILKGLICAREWNPSHTMVVDSDDCVSNRLAEFVNKNSQYTGWFIDKGYRYQERNQLIYFKNKDFYTMCGTCNIIRYDLMELPDVPEYNRGYGYYKNYYIDHEKLRGVLAEKSIIIEPLPFAGAVYIIESGENIYYNNIENKFYQNKNLLNGSRGFYPQIQETIKLLNCRYLNQTIRKEFNLYDIDS